MTFECCQIVVKGAFPSVLTIRKMLYNYVLLIMNNNNNVQQQNFATDLFFTPSSCMICFCVDR